jgi:hypothetical protein
MSENSEGRPNRDANEGQEASAVPDPMRPEAGPPADVERDTALAAPAMTLGAGAAVAGGDLGVDAAYKQASQE